MTTVNEMVITVDGGSASSADATVAGQLAPVVIASPALSTLTDVAITAPASGEVLQYNGSAWANVAVPAVSPALNLYINSSCGGF